MSRYWHLFVPSALAIAPAYKLAVKVARYRVVNRVRRFR